MANSAQNIPLTILLISPLSEGAHSALREIGIKLQKRLTRPSQCSAKKFASEVQNIVCMKSYIEGHTMYQLASLADLAKIRLNYFSLSNKRAAHFIFS